MVQREEMYFEPRCVGSDLRIRWYGEQYSAPELERHYEETVYIRDSGKELMVYSMEADCWDEKAKIKATFSLICRIQKHSTGFRYGRKIPVGGEKMPAKSKCETKSTDYIIISRPAYVQLECPYCENVIEIPFENVTYNTDYWGDGGYCTCLSAKKKLNLMVMSMTKLRFA